MKARLRPRWPALRPPTSTAGVRPSAPPASGYEFVPGTKTGWTVFDELVSATNPDDVCFEMDVFWAYVAGADPVALLKRYPTRWAALHVKDARNGVERKPGTSGLPPENNVAVGAGEIDWKAVLGTAQKDGVALYIIEDETPAPLVNIPKSLAYLKHIEL